MHGTDPDVKAFFESIQIKQEGDRAILNAAMPYGFLRKMLAESTDGFTRARNTFAASAREIHSEL